MNALTRTVSASIKVAKINQNLFINAANFSVLKGTVKFFDPVKGFGFITPENGEEEVFVHQTEIKADGFRSLADGEDVEFEIRINEERGGKKYAANVTGPDGANVLGSVKQQTTRNRPYY